MSTKEFWQRQIIIASRHKRPASFGFYSPARDDAEGEGSSNRKKVGEFDGGFLKMKHFQMFMKIFQSCMTFVGLDLSLNPCMQRGTPNEPLLFGNYLFLTSETSSITTQIR